MTLPGFGVSKASQVLGMTRNMGMAGEHDGTAWTAALSKEIPAILSLIKVGGL